MRPKYPQPTQGYDRWSSSELELFRRCGIAWEFRHEKGDWKTNSRLAIGSAIHTAAAEDGRARLIGSRLKPAQVVDLAIAAFDAELASNETEESRSDVALGRDSCADAAVTYGSLVSPTFSHESVRNVETPLVAYLEGADKDGNEIKVELVGTPDRVDYGATIDIKTGRKWTPEDAIKSIQLTIYSALVGSEGVKNDLVCIDNIYERRDAWHYERLTSSRGEQDQDILWEILVRVTKARRAGVALPAANDAWWCSKKCCPYFRSCPAVKH